MHIKNLISTLAVVFISIGIISSNGFANKSDTYSIKELNNRNDSILILNSTNFNTLDKTDLKEAIDNYDKLLIKIDNINKTYLSNLTHSNNDYIKLDELIFRKEYDSAPVEEINLRNEYTNLLSSEYSIKDYDSDIQIENYNIKDNLLSITVSRDIKLIEDIHKDNVKIEPIDDTGYESYIFEKSDDDWILKKVFIELSGNKNEEMIALENSTDLQKYLLSRNNSYTYTKQDIEDLQKCISKNYSDKELEENIIMSEGLKEIISDSETVSSTRLTTHWKNYAKADALNYALRYWENYNPIYMNFNGMGGDCTNFASQCIHNAGLAMNGHWYHWSKSSYSKSWIHSEHLRNYLLNDGIATGHWKYPPSYPSGIGLNGTVVQGSNGSSWCHSAIVRSGTTTSNIKVVQHSPNKKNYIWKYSPAATRYFRIY